MTGKLLNLFTVLIMIFCLTIPVLAEQNVNLSANETGITLVYQNQSELVLQIDIATISLETLSLSEGDFVGIGIDKFARSQKIGEPNLPMINKIIAIPFGCDLRVQAVNYDIKEIDLNDYGFSVPVLPVQPSLSKSQDLSDVEFQYNQDVYQKSGYYSLPLVESSKTGVMRALNLGMVSIAPVQYDPVANKIRIYNNLTVSVEFVNADWQTTSEMREKYYSPFFEPVYNKIINYEPLPPTILNDLVKYPVKYLIISDRMFEAQLQPFIEWKTQKGFTVITAYTDDIGYSNTAIKTYIRDQYVNSNPPADQPPSFVLLVGDDQQIPAFSGVSGDHISDLYFCEFTNDYNPEIYYGRFSAQTPALLQPQIDKTLEYEKYLMADPSFLANVTMIAGVDGTFAPTHGNGQINYGVNIYFNSSHGITSNTFLYPASNQPGAAADIIQTVNDGIGFINYTAHGGHDQWVDPEFYSSDVSSLTNDGQYPLAIGNCCVTVTFGDDYSSPCVGEVWLQSANKGAIGYIGGSNNTYWDEDYYFGVGYGPVIGNGPSYEQTGLGAYDGVFHNHGEPTANHYVVNDAILFCGNMAVQESGSGLIDYYWEIYHLLGDPSITTYLGMPALNTANHANAIVVGAATFSVQADPASYIGFSKDGVLHGAGYVDETGSIELAITPFSIPGPAQLVITGQNKQPYISDVMVITPSGPYVVFDSCAVNDQLGNGNELIDFGESIVLGTQLANVGPDTAYGITAILYTSDEYITLTDSIEVFGDIIGDFGYTYIDTAFAFDVATDVPDGHVIHFELEITDSSNNTWTSNFIIVAHAPVIEFVELMIDDSIGGNGNGIFEAGESIELVITVLNDGSTTAETVTALLTTGDTYTTITDSVGTFGILEPDSSANNSADIYVITASSDYPPGHSVDFQLSLTAEGGYNITMEFILRAIESFEYSDGGWIGEGVWQWGIPSSGPNSAYDGEKVWATTLGGNYPNDVDDNLYTISYLIGSPDAMLSFYHWFDIENGYDGGNLAISTDGGISFNVIHPIGGYPDNSISALDEEPGYTNSSSGWELAEFELGNYIGETVQIRFRFGSDYSVMEPGWYLDAVVVIGIGPLVGIDDENNMIPISYSLSQNYPNPFNPTTSIKYGLSVSSDVTISIYDILGRRVETIVNGNQEAGYHTVNWNANSYPSGVYFARMETEEFSKNIKMVLLK